MKSRFIAWVLAISMVLPLFSVGVAADNMTAVPELHSEEASNQLFFRPYERSDNGYVLSETAVTTITMTIDEFLRGVFYFGTDAETAVQIPADDMQGTSNMDVWRWGSGSLPEDIRDIAVRMCVTSFAETTEVSYTADGITYSMPVNVVLPAVGIYNEPVCSEETYAGTTLPYYLRPDGTYQPIYLLASDGRTFESVSALPEFLSCALAEDGSYAVLTVNSLAFEADSQYDFAYTLNDGTSSYYPFYVQDRSPSLKYRYVGGDSGNLEPDGDLYSSLSSEIHNGNWIAVYFVSGDEEELLDFDELTIPTDIMSASLINESNPSYISYMMEDFGDEDTDYSIDYKKDGIKYSLPVEVTLPRRTFYSAPERTKANYVGNALSFNGSLTDASQNEYETFYFFADDDEKVTAIAEDLDFFEYVIPDGEVYAVVNIYEGFAENTRYSIDISIAEADATEPYTTKTIFFTVSDARPGLKYRSVGGSSENPEPYGELYSSLSSGIDSGNWIAVYFVSDDEEELLNYAELTIPTEIMSTSLVNESIPYYFRFEMESFGEGNAEYSIDYEKDGIVYSLPATVTLPRFAFYSESTRTKETYVSNTFSFAGSNTDSSGNKYETYYFFAGEGERVTSVTETLDFCEVTVPSGKSYAVVNIYEGFAENTRYKINVSIAKANATDPFTTQSVSFYVKDVQPCLKYRHLLWDRTTGEYYIDPSAYLYNSISDTVDRSYWVAIYFVDSEGNEALLTKNDLFFPDYVEPSSMNGNAAHIELSLVDFGTGYITYTIDGEMYSLPVTVSLPAVGFYESDVPSGSAYISDNVIDEFGETKTFYLHWDTETIGNVTDITMYHWSNTDGDVTQPISTTVETVFPDWGITVTPELSENRLKIEAKIGQRQSFYISINGRNSNHISILSLTSYLWSAEKDLGTITYQGTDYTVGFGKLSYDDALYLIPEIVMHAPAGEGIDHLLFVGALSGYDTPQQAEAPADFYTGIKSIETTVVEYQNLDGSSQTISNCTILPADDYSFHGCTTKAVTAHADFGKHFIALLSTTLTYQESETAPVQTTTFEYLIVYSFNEESELGEEFVTLDASDLNTAEKLNDVLKNNDTLVAWLETAHEEEWSLLKEKGLLQNEVPFFGGAVYLNILLPAATYDGIINCGVNESDFMDEYGIHLWFFTGSNDASGNQATIMPGIVITGDITLENVAFIADETYTMAYASEDPFTCGILVAGDSTDTFRNSNIRSCSFDGFDYGLRTTPDGHASLRDWNVFTNCGVGYYVDSTGYRGKTDPPDYTRFVNCGTAIKIISLPSEESPYYFRISYCDFIGSINYDLDIQQPGRFYCYKNYFGASAVSDIPDTYTEVYYRSAKLNGNGKAEIITNPRWPLPYTFPGTPAADLCIDTNPNLQTYIINREAQSLAVDSAKLDSDLDNTAEDVNINVVDDADKVLGTWTFDGTGSAVLQNLDLMLLSTTQVTGTFNAGLVLSTSAADIVSVTVQDSALLAARKPTLTIPCAYETAYVMYEGVIVRSSVADGKITFQVSAGGIYTIRSGEAPGYVTKDTSGLSWYDYAYDTDDICLAQLTENSDGTVIVSSRFLATPDCSAAMIIALYDKNGHMVTAQLQTVDTDVSEAQTISVQCDSTVFPDNTVTVKIFVLDNIIDLCPLVPAPVTETLFITATGT